MSATKILWGQVITVFAIVLADDLGRDAMDRLAARLSARARPSLVRGPALPVLSAAGLLLVVVRLRRLCAVDLHRGRLYRRVWRHHRRRRRHRHVGVARARGEERRDLRLGALGATEGDRAKPDCSDPTASCSAGIERGYLRHDGPEHVLCFAPTRSGKGVGLVIPSLLTWPGSAIVHDIKGENWQLTAGLRAQHRPRAAVRSDQREVVGLQSAAGGPPRRVGGARRPEHRRHPGRPRRQRSRSAITGRRPATRSWSARSCTSSTPRRTRRSPASRPSCPIRSGRSSRRSRAMMTTPHLGEAGVHPVVASAARELLNKSENERSGVLSHRDVVPRPLPRSRGRRGDAALRLADRRPRRRRAARRRSTSSCRRPTSAGPSR